MTKLYYYELECYDADENEEYTDYGLVSGELNEVVSELNDFCGNNFMSMKLVPLEEGSLSFNDKEVINKFKELKY